MLIGYILFGFYQFDMCYKYDVTITVKDYLQQFHP